MMWEGPLCGGESLVLGGCRRSEGKLGLSGHFRPRLLFGLCIRLLHLREAALSWGLSHSVSQPECCCSLAVCPWANHFNSLGFNILGGQTG